MGTLVGPFNRGLLWPCHHLTNCQPSVQGRGTRAAVWYHAMTAQMGVGWTSILGYLARLGDTVQYLHNHHWMIHKVDGTFTVLGSATLMQVSSSCSSPARRSQGKAKDRCLHGYPCSNPSLCASNHRLMPRHVVSSLLGDAVAAKAWRDRRALKSYTLGRITQQTLIEPRSCSIAGPKS